MYKESKETGPVAHMDGRPVGVCADEGITAEKLAEVAGTIRAAFDAVGQTLKQLARNMQRFADAVALGYKLQQAVRWAEVYNPKLAHIFHHAKKWRIRKKYAKRILAWYQAEVLK